MMFEHVLPYIPVNRIGKLWYTDDNGILQSVDGMNLSSSVLKDIYHCVYTDESENTLLKIHCDSIPATFPGTFSNPKVKLNNSDWKFSLKLVVKSMIKGVNKKDFEYPSNETLEHIFDHDTKVIWTRDNKGLLFKYDDNGDKVYNDNLMENPDCGNTMALNVKVNGNNKIIDQSKVDKCEIMATCILKSAEQLPQCIHHLREQDMFRVAYNELSTMAPSNAEKILKVFNVEIKSSSMLLSTKDGAKNIKIVRPVTYSQWESDVLNSKGELPSGWTQDFIKVLQNNTPLLQYIKGVIAFVTTNPSILNPHITDNSISNGRVEDPQLLKLNLKHYQAPFADTFEELEYNVNSLVNDNNSFRYNIPSLVNPVASNLIYGDGLMGGGIINTMSGGSYTVDNKLDAFGDFGNKFRSLFQDLQNAGINIHQNDMVVLNNSIQEVAKIEKKINEMMKVLKMLNNLQRFVKSCSSNNDIDITSGKTMKLDDIMTNKELLKYINKQVGDYESLIHDSMGHINNNTRDILVSFKDLVDAISYEKKK